MYSYEQFICALLVNYKNRILLGDINKVIMAFKEGRDDFGLIAQGILFIGNYIGYSKQAIWLNCDLEDNINYNGRNISLAEYFNMIAGEELVNFVKEYAKEGYTKQN